MQHPLPHVPLSLLLPPSILPSPRTPHPTIKTSIPSIKEASLIFLFRSLVKDCREARRGSLGSLSKVQVKEIKRDDRKRRFEVGRFCATRSSHKSGCSGRTIRQRSLRGSTRPRFESNTHIYFRYILFLSFILNLEDEISQGGEIVMA